MALQRPHFAWISAAITVLSVLCVATEVHAQRLCTEGSELMTLVPIAPVSLERSSLVQGSEPDDDGDAALLVCVSPNDARCMPGLPSNASTLGASDSLVAACTEVAPLSLVSAESAPRAQRRGGAYRGRPWPAHANELERPPRC